MTPEKSIYFKFYFLFFFFFFLFSGFVGTCAWRGASSPFPGRSPFGEKLGASLGQENKGKS